MNALTHPMLPIVLPTTISAVVCIAVAIWPVAQALVVILGEEKPTRALFSVLSFAGVANAESR